MAEQLTNGKREPIQLGSELGRGGEGSVFQVDGSPELVAKVYHQPLDARKAAKLAAMAAGSTDRLLRIAAWPLDTLHSKAGSATRGFLMRRVKSQRDIHLLYGPRTRLREYPDATFKFLVHVAANLARAFAVVHEHGHVIGDVNQGGVCVTPQGTVTLVDCDSFQFSAGGATYTCDVGSPMYQPPEFQGLHSFGGVARAANHDNFGLAVLLFQTLFLARHPYMGAFQGHGDLPLERAIREFRFAYARDADRRLMRQPPGSLGLGAVPPALASLFERAFLEEGAAGKRPAAAEWIAALDGFAAELKPCQRNPGHAHAPAIVHCPLCELESRIGMALFMPPQAAAMPAPNVKIDELWRDLMAEVKAAALPPAPSLGAMPSIRPPESVARFAQARATAGIIRWIGIAAAVGSAFMFRAPALLAGVAVALLAAAAVQGRPPPEARNVGERLSAAKQRLASVAQLVQREAAHSTLAALENQAKATYRSVSTYGERRVLKLREFDALRHRRQLSRYLEQYEVTRCSISGVTKAKMLGLASYGVETADDVTQASMAVLRNARCGFGPVRTGQLMGWRRDLERRFRPKPADAADALERTKLERELQNEQNRDLTALIKVFGQVKSVAGPMKARSEALRREVAEAQQELGQLTAVAEALRARA